MPKERTNDVLLFIYQDCAPPPRVERLTDCAGFYADWRGWPGHDFELGRAPGGKPFFLHCPNLHFSLSHSGEYWLAAFSGASLGLDIQQHKQLDHLALAKRWYHAQEYAAVQQNGAGLFFDIWSAKESLVKHSGAGLSSSLPTFSVMEGGAVAAQVGAVQLKQLPMFVGYSLCLCAEIIGDIYAASCLDSAVRLLNL